MSKLLLVIGICQIVAGVVIVGLVGKDFYDTADTPKSLKVDAFGPVLIGLLVVVNGVFGVMTMCCADNKKMQVFYLIGAAVAATAAAAMVWIYALNVYNCRDKSFLKISLCSEETKNVRITLLAFSIISSAMSIFGMVSSALTICRKL